MKKSKQEQLKTISALDVSKDEKEKLTEAVNSLFDIKYERLTSVGSTFKTIRQKIDDCVSETNEDLKNFTSSGSWLATVSSALE